MTPDRETAAGLEDDEHGRPVGPVDPVIEELNRLALERVVPWLDPWEAC